MVLSKTSEHSMTIFGNNTGVFLLLILQSHTREPNSVEDHTISHKDPQLAQTYAVRAVLQTRRTPSSMILTKAFGAGLMDEMYCHSKNQCLRTVLCVAADFLSLPHPVFGELQ